MSTPTPTSMQQSFTGNTGNPTTGNATDHQSSNTGAGAVRHHRHHAIARVASAHGPRDSILSLQQYHHQQHQQQQQAEQQSHYHRHHSPSPMLVTSGAPSRLIGGSAPPALCPGVIGLPPPPQYEQAVAAAAFAAIANNDKSNQSGEAGGSPNLTRFANRRSPESRTPIQAVLPMQPSLAREVIPSPTSIPDECQVVKQLVREMASGQLSVIGSGFGGNEGGTVATQTVMTAPAPPAYQQNQQLQGIRQLQQQQQHQPASVQQQKASNPLQHPGAPSSAHPLLDGGPSQGGFASSSTSAYVSASHQPKDGQQRMSLSHPDLSRIQNLQYSAWPATAVNVDAPSSPCTGPPIALHSAAALSSMAASFTSSPGSPQSSAVRSQQRPTLQQQQQQQLLLQQHQIGVNAAANLQQQQQSFAGKILEHGMSITTGQLGQSAGAAGPAQPNRLAYLQAHSLVQSVPAASYEYELIHGIDPASFVRGAASNAMMAGAVQQQSFAPGALPQHAHEFVHRSPLDHFEADLEASAFTRMINLLKDENKKLRTELDGYMKKAFKLQQLELQYQKLHREYEDLVQRQEKREELEHQMVNKMRQENVRLRELNVQMRDQLENTLAQIAHLHADDAEDAELRRELVRREMMMAQLVTQNKELLACKERQEIELEAQRQTLDDQREHIHILDKALQNAQERNLRLDEEVKTKTVYMKRAEQLEATVKQLQDTIQKRDDSHKLVRAQLEKEIAQLQVQKKDTQFKKVGSSKSLLEYDETLAKLKRELRDKDDQLAGLQQDVVKWQNMYYEELKKRQTALDEAADNKDARIRLLEETSDKAEKMAESARVESKRYLDDLRTSNSKITELQTKVQGLEARLAEKDAMINVLRRRQNAPFGDSSINARSSDSTLVEPFNPNETKQRIEAVRRRLLQSPSPVRYTPRLYQRHAHKFPSIDASFNLADSDYGSLRRAGRRSKTTSTVHTGTSSSVTGTGRSGMVTDTSMTGTSDISSSGRVQHGRTQSSCDSYLTPSAAASVATSASSALGAFKQREIFTLPTRRSRTKLLTAEQVKSIRPRSADDHLLTRPGSSMDNNSNEMKPSDACVIGMNGMGSEQSTPDSSTIKDSQDSDENGEELWHV